MFKNRIGIKSLVCVCLIAGIVCSGIVMADESKNIDKEKRDNIIKLIKPGYNIKIMKQMFEKSFGNMVTEKDYQELAELMIPVYEKYYDNEDIKEMLKFNETPVGKKMIENGPLIMKETMEIAAKWASKWTKNMMEKGEKDGTIDKNTTMGQMMIKGREGATKGNLAAIRSAVSIYYSEKEGEWPKSLTSGFENFLYPIPQEKITGSNKVVTKFDGTGGWYYDMEKGNVYLNLSGKDSSGKDYSEY
ncbi:MAG: DUF2059 domain-containing protein [Candidatus Firestonebacteria bacterium]